MLQPRLALFATLLALVVVTLGAYVRLSDAGLGCPDWPGCYGALTVPNDSSQIAQANAAYPGRPLDAAKAWKEMTHRYLASALGLAIIALALLGWRRRALPGQPAGLALLLVGLVILQGLLGMWTVTLLVKPAVVTLHLLGGMATLSLLWLLRLRLLAAATGPPTAREPNALRWLALLALLVLVAQIALGGWTSSNYAAVACTDFPRCQPGQWWPESDFAEAFVLWRGIGIDYEFGVLDSAARTAIHLSHRLGALLTLLLLGLVSVAVWRHGHVPATRRLGALLGLLLVAQVGLGVGNVLGHLPIAVAVAHNGTAALLLLTLVTLLWRLRDGPA